MPRLDGGDQKGPPPIAGEGWRALIGYMVSVVSVAFSPDGKRCLTGSADGTARIWDL